MSIINIVMTALGHLNRTILAISDEHNAKIVFRSVLLSSN